MRNLNSVLMQNSEFYWNFVGQRSFKDLWDTFVPVLTEFLLPRGYSDILPISSRLVRSPIPEVLVLGHLSSLKLGRLVWIKSFIDVSNEPYFSLRNVNRVEYLASNAFFKCSNGASCVVLFHVLLLECQICRI